MCHVRLSLSVNNIDCRRITLTHQNNKKPSFLDPFDKWSTRTKSKDAQILEWFQSLRRLGGQLSAAAIIHHHNQRLRPPSLSSASAHIRSPLSCRQERTVSYQVRRERHPLNTSRARSLRHHPLVLLRSTSPGANYNLAHLILPWTSTLIYIYIWMFDFSGL